MALMCENILKNIRHSISGSYASINILRQYYVQQTILKEDIYIAYC